MAYDYDRRTAQTPWQALSRAQREKALHVPSSKAKALDEALEGSVLKSWDDLKVPMTDHGYLPTVRDSKLLALFNELGLPHAGNQSIKSKPTTPKAVIKTFIQEDEVSSAYPEGEYADGEPKYEVHDSLYISLGTDNEGVDPKVLEALEKVPAKRGKARGSTWGFGYHAEGDVNKLAKHMAESEIFGQVTWKVGKAEAAGLRSTPKPAKLFRHAGADAGTQALIKHIEKIIKDLAAKHPEYRWAKPKHIKNKNRTLEKSA